MDAVYVATWLVLMAGSTLGYRLSVPWQLVVIVMAPLVLVGIGWKPVFGVCPVCAIFPIGTAILLPGTVTAATRSNWKVRNTAEETARLIAVAWPSRASHRPVGSAVQCRTDALPQPSALRGTPLGESAVA